MPKISIQPRYKKVADLIRKRIVFGDYGLKPIPSERQLAAEMGVNYMTVRRGLRLLEQENLVIRQPNGRARTTRVQQGAKKHLNLAFLMPTMVSPQLELWRWALEQVTLSRSCSVRPILYMHWDDPMLLDSLAGFDGIFLNPIPDPLPESTAEQLRNREHPVVVVGYDFSSYGIPSIEIFPPVFVQRLLDHLASLGHRHIGCLNTQPDDSEVQRRINQWRYWMAAHGFSGRVIDQSVKAHGDVIGAAHRAMCEILAGAAPEETAWFCTTAPAALGVIRAILDRGLVPGRDIAVCTANGEGLAARLNPPLTALELSDPTPFISVCLDWMIGGGQNWQGPLLMQPETVPLIIRESTQPGTGSGLSSQSWPR